MGLFEQMTPNEARLTVLAVGAVLIALIYAWGNRVRLRASLDERRRRRAQRAADVPPLADEAGTGAGTPVTPGLAPGYGDPFAHQRLVDVEIVPVRRDAAGAAVTDAVTTPAEPAPAPQQAQVQPEPAQPPQAAPLAPAIPEAEAAPAAPAAAAPAVAAPETPVVRPPRKPVTPPAPKLDAEVGMTWSGAAARTDAAPRTPLPAGGGIPPLNLRPAANAAGAPAAAGPSLHVVLTVMADPGARFTGMELLMAAHDLGLKFSKQGLFDGYVNGEVRGKPVFSIANVIEPGVFPPGEVQQLSTPGLLLFMKLPGSVAEPLPSLELMLSQARRLAAKLNGTLCDEQRRRLGPDGISELRLRVTDFQRRLRQTAPA